MTTDPGRLVIEIEIIPDPPPSTYVGEFYPRWACEALERLLKERGVYPPSGRRRPGTVDAEEILDALFGAVVSVDLLEGSV